MLPRLPKNTETTCRSNAELLIVTQNIRYLQSHVLINFLHPALRNSPLREAYEFTRLETHSPFYHPIFNLNSTTNKNKSLTYEQKVCYYVQTFFEIERR